MPFNPRPRIVMSAGKIIAMHIRAYSSETPQQEAIELQQKLHDFYVTKVRTGTFPLSGTPFEKEAVRRLLHNYRF